jgi:hypothetical protein
LGLAEVNCSFLAASKSFWHELRIGQGSSLSEGRVDFWSSAFSLDKRGSSSSSLDFSWWNGFLFLFGLEASSDRDPAAATNFVQLGLIF